MLVEQAFFHLPEILHGSGYNRQEYEAGIVGALSLAILQILNGRNAANPISYLQLEKLYRTKGLYVGAAAPRYLRADLYIKTHMLKIGSTRLAQYGWRHSNWLEAKFLRGQSANGTKHAGNKTVHVASFLADLLRLSVLVPEKGEQSCNGRYFLHVYDSDPKWYLTFGNRAWMKAICRPGQQRVKLKDLDLEPQTVTKYLGSFPGLEIDLALTNYVIEPLGAGSPPSYWMYLTRIDGIKAKLGAHEYEVARERILSASSPSALEELSKFVSETIHIKPASPDSLPALSDDDEPGDTDSPESGDVSIVEESEQASRVDRPPAALT